MNKENCALKLVDEIIQHIYGLDNNCTYVTNNWGDVNTE